MCGFAGILSKEKVSKNILKSVLESLRSRGPDDKGIYQDKNICLVHRRLSIIDLSPAGRQPMVSQDKNYVICYNGEIYNYKNLRKKLKFKRLRGKSDTEVLLYLLQEKGSEIIPDLDGIFAFAYWNKKSGELILVRDRLGTKPLYYFFNEKKFIFASTIKAILHTGNIKAEINERALAEYFTFQNLLGEETLFKNIYLLPPASILKFKNGRITKEKYFEPVSKTKKDKGKNYYLEKLKYLLKKSVENQLIRDKTVKLGSYLSSGIDTNSIVSFASARIQNLPTFTCGWDLKNVQGREKKFDERELAKLSSSYFKTIHHEIILSSKDMERMISNVVCAQEELRLGMSYSSQYVAKKASKFCKIILSGTGGDEFFGGYPWRYKIFQNISSEKEFLKKSYTYWTRLIKDKEKKSFFAKNIWDKVKSYSSFDSFSSAFKNKKFKNAIENEMYFEIKSFLHGLLLIEDKISMNYSLETRVPLLSNDLIDFALSLPIKYKTDKNKGKILFREAIKNLVPNKVFNAKKQGFSSPDESWYRGPSKKFVKTTLLGKKSRIKEYIRSSYIKNILQEHQKGIKNNRLIIWSLLSFEKWLNCFLK